MEAEHLLPSGCILTLPQLFLLKLPGPESSEMGDSTKIGILGSPDTKNITCSISEAIWHFIKEAHSVSEISTSDLRNKDFLFKKQTKLFAESKFFYPPIKITMGRKYNFISLTVLFWSFKHHSEHLSWRLGPKMEALHLKKATILM